MAGSLQHITRIEENIEVLSLLNSYPDGIRDRLLRIRELVFETAHGIPAVGGLHETLKWGQPSYQTVRPKTGTTIRLDRDKSDPGGVALFVSCNTSLVHHWRGLFPNIRFGGNRSVHFPQDRPIPVDALEHMIAMALTYHVNKRAASA